MYVEPIVLQKSLPFPTGQGFRCQNEHLALNVAEFKWDESMKTCLSVSLGFGSGLLASNYKAFVFPLVDLQSWTFKCDRGAAMSVLQKERSDLGFCPVFLQCVQLSAQISSLLRCLLLSAGRCHFPITEPSQHWLWCWLGKTWCAFPFLLSAVITVCAQSRHGVLLGSGDPALSAKQGSKTSVTGMTSTRASGTVGLARQRHCALFGVGC